MNFSIVLPSKGERLAVRKMLDSFERTTKHKDSIEVLIAIDEGETDIVDFVNYHNYSFSIKFFERPKTSDFTNDYYNWMACRSIGKNVMAFNDDAWIRTQNWDEKILKAIDKSGWSVYFVYLQDTARIKYGHYFPCFPCVSRRAMNTLGYLLFPGVRMYPADKLTYDVYRGTNRIVYVNDVLIEHEHVVEADESKKEMMEIYKEDMKNSGSLDYSEDVVKLLQVMVTDNVRKKAWWLKRPVWV